MKKLAKKIIAAVAGIAAIAACAVPFRTGGAEALIAGAETPATSHDLELANEYRVQDGVKMSPIAYIDVERSCEHGDGAASTPTRLPRFSISRRQKVKPSRGFGCIRPLTARRRPRRAVRAR